MVTQIIIQLGILAQLFMQVTIKAQDPIYPCTFDVTSVFPIIPVDLAPVVKYDIDSETSATDTLTNTGSEPGDVFNLDVSDADFEVQDNPDNEDCKELCFGGTNTKCLQIPFNVNDNVQMEVSYELLLRQRSIANNRGWIMSHDDNDFDRSILMHDSRFAPAGETNGLALASGGVGNAGIYQGVEPLDSDYTHIVAVFGKYSDVPSENGKSKLYIDGASQGEDYICINNRPSQDHGWDGCFSQIRIYDRALADDEALALFYQAQSDEESCILDDSGVSFNFPTADVDRLLGNKDWNGKSFDVNNDRLAFDDDGVREVTLWRTDDESGPISSGALTTPVSDPGSDNRFQPGDTLTILKEALTCLSASDDTTCDSSIEVVSVDHADDDPGQSGEFFNFDLDEIDRILGRNDWDGRVFLMRNSDGIIREVILFRSRNGGTYPASIVNGGRGRIEEGSMADDWMTGDMLSFVDTGTVCDADCDESPIFDAFLDQCSGQYDEDISDLERFSRVNRFLIYLLKKGLKYGEGKSGSDSDEGRSGRLGGSGRIREEIVSTLMDGILSEIPLSDLSEFGELFEDVDEE